MKNVRRTQPLSSGSDNPGILPASRPCFTAKASLGQPRRTPTPKATADLLVMAVKSLPGPASPDVAVLLLGSSSTWPAGS